ncbi:MAG TPA: T9SS type A sorting domain-containing protein [Chitinophagaceae bacterium]|nr:T9SS type A sorting domain-containing protein [Chitinophagaceae bacterium]
MSTINKLCCWSLLLAVVMSCTSTQKPGEDIRASTEMDGLEKVMQQEFLMTRDPQLNRVPRERLEIAHEYMKNLVINTNGTANRTQALAWQERGPNNVGGRTRAIMIDKRDATGNTVFAASVSGGLFKTTNFTSAVTSWAPVNDFLPNLAITALIQDPVNMNIMYAGTGEGWINVDAVLGNGIYKSTDGGVTWLALPFTIDPSTIFDYVQDLAIDNNGNIYAAMRNVRSSIRGVQRSTDGGATWTQVLGAPLINPGTGQEFWTGRAADLEVASNGDIYASLGLVGAAVTNRSIVMKSSFATHGANTGAVGTWTQITPTTVNPTQRTEIVVAPSDPNRVYLLMQDSASHEVQEMFRSTNGGSTWTPLSPPGALNNGSNSQTWFNLIGAVDPANPDALVVGGLQLARSTNGGDTWRQISTNSVMHVDQHALQFMGSSKLLVGNDGGVYYTENADVASPTQPTWINKNNGYNITQFYGTDLHPTNANYFLAGAQDNGSQRFVSAGMNTTSIATGGDGGFPHIDQQNSQLQITSFTGNNYARSLDGGLSFQVMSSVNNNRGQFINPTDLDDNSKILYCGDNADRYFFITGLLSSPVGNIANVPLMGGKEVTAIRVDQSAAHTIYVGASFGGIPQVIKISNANTTSPTVLSNANLGTIANANLSSIDIDPNNSNHLVATLSNFGVTSVWESTNGGISFSSIEGNLPDIPVRWAIFAPPTAQLNGTAGGNGGIILATELGVWTTSQINGAATQWIPNNSGLANVRTDMLRYRAVDNTLVAATHGRGLFTTNLPNVVTGVSNNPVTRDFIRYVSAENDQLLIVTGSLQTRNMNIQILNMLGQQVYATRNNYQNTAISLGQLQRGAYIVRILGDKKEYFVQHFIKR